MSHRIIRFGGDNPYKTPDMNVYCPLCGQLLPKDRRIIHSQSTLYESGGFHFACTNCPAVGKFVVSNVPYQEKWE